MSTTRQSRAGSSTPQGRRPRRVLVVDDHLDSAQSFAHLVEQIVGHQVEFAINGYAALQLARKIEPEIVFLDLMMPGINGFELARRLRQEFGETIRLIAVTGHGTEEDRGRSAKAGCEMHLIKPVPAQVVEGLLA